MPKHRALFLIGPCLAAGFIILCWAAAGSNAAGPNAACDVPSGPYATIQAAANDGNCATIEVAAGTFVEHLSISRTVTIQGQGQGQTMVDGAAGNMVFSIVSGASVTLTGMTIQNGSAPAYGGGIYNVDGMLTMTGITLSSNSASQGGGIYNSGTLIINHSILSGNVAGDGGAIFNIGSVTVYDSTLSGNSGLFGGGIHNFAGTLMVIRSTLSGNSTPATQWGGGIWNGGAATIANSTLSGNTSGNGGGIYNSPYAGTMTIIDSTLSGNSATGNGGGIFNEATVTVRNSTLSTNTAGNGGGIANLDTLNVANSILANNTVSGVGLGPDCWGNLTSQDYNLVEDVTGCAIAGSIAHNITGQDPLLSPLQNNGGPTLTLALGEGSPALDAGYCPGAVADQRGFPRPADLPPIANAADGCDMGAIEFLHAAYLPLISRPS